MISNAARFGERFLSVGAIDRQNNPWSDANGATNSGASVYAPGAAVRSTALGSGFFVDSGTSYAAPFVTGLITVLWQLDRSLILAKSKCLSRIRTILPRPGAISLSSMRLQQ